ncbi:MAG: HAMP domain-containing sensor histidine kinase [Candidatus Sumerlaeales bacterium]|nr:HAMP domain-containing sensor histidine kinase [Candidatus Sumerlaeales bacterium]
MNLIKDFAHRWKMKRQAQDAIEQDFLGWLLTSEKKAILPFKWGVMVTAMCFWIISRRSTVSMTSVIEVNGLFLLYFAATFVESFFLRFKRIKITQIRWITTASYFADFLFILGLNHFALQYSQTAEKNSSPIFLLLFFLLILRGMTIFRTTKSSFSANVLTGTIASIFVITSRLKIADMLTPVDIASLLFIALVVAGTWFISGVILSQKEELMLAREKIARNENLAVIGQLASGMAHEINNPLGIIHGYAEYLLMKNPMDENREDYEKILKETKRCKVIVGELLSQVRVRPLLFERFDILALLKECMENAAKSYTTDKPDLSISVNGGKEEAIIVYADKTRLHKALSNISINAASAAPQTNGRITGNIAVVNNGADISIRIWDNGDTISDSVAAKAFDPFFTQKEKGTGLGLWIAFEAVRMHNGTISLNNAPQGGVEVVIQIPREQPEKSQKD